MQKRGIYQIEKSHPKVMCHPTVILFNVDYLSNSPPIPRLTNIFRAPFKSKHILPKAHSVLFIREWSPTVLVG